MAHTFWCNYWIHCFDLYVICFEHFFAPALNGTGSRYARRHARVHRVRLAARGPRAGRPPPGLLARPPGASPRRAEAEAQLAEGLAIGFRNSNVSSHSYGRVAEGLAIGFRNSNVSSYMYVMYYEYPSFGSDHSSLN